MTQGSDIISLEERRDRGERTDDELMLLARSGRAEAFETLVRRHQAVALAVASKYLGQRALAQDVAQEAFIQLYRSLDQYRARGRFRAYFHRVLINQCRMATRSHKSRQSLRDRYGRESDLDGSELSEEQLIARERSREVELAVRELSDKLRSAVVLRFSAGLSYQEIADALGIKVGTVKSRLSSALDKLRTHLEEVDEPR